MPVWRSVSEKVKVGDVIDDYIVSEIKMMVPCSILIRNHSVRSFEKKYTKEQKEELIKLYGVPELEEEILVPYARLTKDF